MSQLAEFRSFVRKYRAFLMIPLLLVFLALVGLIFGTHGGVFQLLRYEF